MPIRYRWRSEQEILTSPIERHPHRIMMYRIPFLETVQLGDGNP